MKTRADDCIPFSIHYAKRVMHLHNPFVTHAFTATAYPTLHADYADPITGISSREGMVNRKFVNTSKGCGRQK